MRRTTIAALAAVLALGACKVSVNDKGKLPDVDVKDTRDGARVDITPGEMPDVDVKADSAAVPRVNLPDVDPPNVDVNVNDGDTPRRDTARE
jgi:hypothetical protein